MPARQSHRITARSIPILLLAVLAVLGGCTKTYRYSPDEAAASSRQHFDLVVVPSTIRGVVALERIPVADTAGIDSATAAAIAARPPIPRVFWFDSAGGTIDVDQRVVSGRLKGGEERRFPFDSVLYAQFGGIDKHVARMSIKEYVTAQALALQTSPKELKWRSYPCWNVVRYNQYKGVRHVEAGSITGRTRGGSQLEIPFSSVRYLEYHEPNVYKTARIGMTTFVLAIIILGATHNLTM